MSSGLESGATPTTSTHSKTNGERRKQGEGHDNNMTGILLLALFKLQLYNNWWYHQVTPSLPPHCYPRWKEKLQHFHRSQSSKKLAHRILVYYCTSLFTIVCLQIIKNISITNWTSCCSLFTSREVRWLRGTVILRHASTSGLSRYPLMPAASHQVMLQDSDKQRHWGGCLFSSYSTQSWTNNHFCSVNKSPGRFCKVVLDLAEWQWAVCHPVCTEDELW